MDLIRESYLLLFFTCAVLGWIMEVVCKLIQFGRFINRGFLIGPYCPIYGTGAVAVTLLLSRYEDSPLLVFVMAMVICGTLEYLTSYLMEKLFHARWWDYSQRRFNLNGRVCANTLIPFGLLGLALIYLARPMLFRFYAQWPETLRHAVCAGILLILLADTVVSTVVLGRIRKMAELTGGDDTEELTRRVREALRSRGMLARRALHAFPHARLYNRRLLRRLHEARAEIRLELKRREARLREEIRGRKK